MHKQTVINGKIVYANRFLRWGEAAWDFLYDHVLPVKIWYRLIDWKDRVKYALERAFTGYDRRISWGYESTISFYKRMLSDLYKNVHGCPGSIEDLKTICPEEWSEIEEKWKPELKDGITYEDLFVGNTSDEKLSHLFFEDCFQAWRKYIKRVLHYFEEADPESSSKKGRQEELYAQMKNPFDEKERTVVEHNGQYFYQYPSLGNSEEDNRQREILRELSEIDEYYLEQLKLGMAEIAKNIIYLND